MSSRTSVLLVGCGRMGGSLLKGWIASGAVDRAVAVDPFTAEVPAGVALHKTLAEAADPLPETILLAVKPQMLGEVLPALKARLPKGVLVISIAAGKSIATLQAGLGADVPVIRTMPNTPAAIGRGITVCCAGLGVSPAQRATAETLMSAVGEVAWVEDESLMHAVTAVSGSGPAYVFLLIETLAEAGVAAGLPPDLARRLARSTVIGAGALADASPDDAAKLRADVTSPGGTTAAALSILMGNPGLSDLMRRAVEAARKRGEELAG